MSRFGLFFSLLSLLFASSLASDVALNLTARPSALAATYKSAGWTLQTQRASWAGRGGGVVEWYTGSVWTGSRMQPGNWLLMYGAGIWACYDDCSAKAEVWASANQGRSWIEVLPQQTFPPLMSPQTVQDNRGYQYRIQGTDYGHGCNGDVFPDVYMSSDGGYRWLPQGDGVPSHHRSLPGPGCGGQQQHHLRHPRPDLQPRHGLRLPAERRVGLEHSGQDVEAAEAAGRLPTRALCARQRRRQVLRSCH